MGEIHILDDMTIDQIAAGEVVERPLSVVKELVENAIDAGAGMITVEIKDGGIAMIRVTDDGCGIDRTQVEKAFMRHATSKIQSAADLPDVTSLGFRGEALSSICAVCQVELITKTREAFTGTLLKCSGGKAHPPAEVGAPDGTTVIARNIFYNTPARQKFLKSKTTEGSYISDLMQHLALSRPQIAFKFIQNGQTRFFTSGNGDVVEILYRIYGKEVSSNMIHVQKQIEGLHVSAYLGKPVLNRSSRAFETFFVNGRYVKSKVLSAVLEEGYKNHLMQHKFPFAVLYYTIDTDKIDVNVHPAKREIRIQEPDSFFFAIRDWIKETLLQSDLIPEVRLTDEEPSGQEIAKRQRELTKLIPEPFEKAKAEALMRETGIYRAGQEQRQNGTGQEPEAAEKTDTDGKMTSDKTSGIVLQKADRSAAAEDRGADSPQQSVGVNGQEKAKNDEQEAAFFEEHIAPSKILGTVGQPQQGLSGAASNVIKAQDQKPYTNLFDQTEAKRHARVLKQKDHIFVEKAEQMDLTFDKFFEESTKEKYRLLGQIFETYWLITCNDKLFIMDQHAAHEKVMYEKLVKQMEEHTLETQQLNPPIILSMTQGEEQTYLDYEEHFASLGFLLEEFGGNEYALREVPLNLYGYDERELFLSVLDSLMESPVRADIRIVLEKIASMSCKAAIKGNQRISVQEAQGLVDTLFTLENPYACPHGRPTIISMSKYEIEKKFKRIV